MASEAVVGFVRDWRMRYACACPTAALCSDLRLAPDVMALLLARLEDAGRIRRVRGSLGALDVELVA